MSEACKNCAKQFLCEEFNSVQRCSAFLSWIYILKTMERCIKMKIPKKIIKNNSIFYLTKIYKNFAKYKNSQGWYECFGFHELGLIEYREHERQANKGGVIKM